MEKKCIRNFVQVSSNKVNLKDFFELLLFFLGSRWFFFADQLCYNRKFFFWSVWKWSSLFDDGKIRGSFFQRYRLCCFFSSKNTNFLDLLSFWGPKQFRKRLCLGGQKFKLYMWTIIYLEILFFFFTNQKTIPNFSSSLAICFQRNIGVFCQMMPRRRHERISNVFL